MDSNIKKFSPLTEATYYILLALVEPLHGYGIIKKVEEMSNGRVQLAAGTLYGAIKTLLENDLIILIGEDKENKRRKLYQMTEDGRILMNYEIKRLQEMVNNGLQEIGGQL
ncbi:PadR family transcriptional regulator [Vallitalea guaymasensis]|uniref:Helix-turn-helix transcriptional regulator n=1 Tax=Vallitalea guaymasensis TaxID=1185412 RepID=A0A8J8MDN7_9FIRM|nr:helix-turn-helix transcriptional regulator [Vallitalea guaymasensis]QUH30934.1 helix-turn-helix transcriptional regulator [Vallitalea guaymasensis]